ncbi:SDR family NAD(P)-dependent oxidoreductase [Shimia sp. SDUM112013]|uniref:SDR family NAD(P)-dependent oxidoreductase n=1 Tax=Shimia sp. SDUM112013 TaxID=3136160 RepID=UPI0032EBA018
MIDPRHDIALVTGAGSGLGQALALELVQKGLSVIGFGRRDSALQDTMSKAQSDRFVPMVVDVADSKAVEQAFQSIEQTLGHVTLLINNAGIYPRRDIFDETGASFMEVVGTNLGGTVSCTISALLYMGETGFGRIINVSSFADMAPLPASSAYAVSKGAGRIFGAALHADLHDRFPEIIVNTWMPGMLATDMGIQDGLDPAIAAKWGVGLALWHDPSLNGAIFEMNREVPAPRGLKRKIKDLILLRRPPKPRVVEV